MPSIIDYQKEQGLEHIFINELVHRAKYLMAIREEMIGGLEDLDKKLDDIVKEMKDAGIDVNLDDSCRP